MRKIVFTTDGFAEYNRLLEEDFSFMQKIQLLLRNIQDDPFKGLGKPEPLRGKFFRFLEPTNKWRTPLSLQDNKREHRDN